MPKIHQSYHSTFQDLIQECLQIWTSHEGRAPVVCCKVGRHRSFAFLIAFLMWASHVHDLSLWADLVASEHAEECDLLYLKLADMPDRPWAQ